MKKLLALIIVLSSISFGLSVSAESTELKTNTVLEGSISGRVRTTWFI